MALLPMIKLLIRKRPISGVFNCVHVPKTEDMETSATKCEQKYKYGGSERL